MFVACTDVEVKVGNLQIMFCGDLGFSSVNVRRKREGEKGENHLRALGKCSSLDFVLNLCESWSCTTRR